MGEQIDKVILYGFLISGAIAILIVMSVIVIAVTQTFNRVEYNIPEVLSNWGGIIVGFYFGTFVSLIKDYMKIPSPEPDQGSETTT